MKKSLRPARGPLRGSLSIPGDKSIAHRALVLGSICEGTLHLRNVPSGQDVLSTRRCMTALGATIEGEGASLHIKGAGLDGLRAPSSELDCGNSGTTMRLLMGLLSGQPFESVLIGDASLSRRPMGRVADPLRAMGAKIELSAARSAPVRILAGERLSALTYRLPVPSAQVKTALLLAGLRAGGETVVEDPFGTRDHTERMLKFLCPEETFRSGDKAMSRRSRLRSDKSLTIPGDVSTAAFYLAAAALVPGSSVTLKRVGLNPTRTGFIEVLREMGAKITAERGGQNGQEPVGDVAIEHASLRGVRVAAERIPALVDEAPLLAVVAAAADGETRIEGLAELRVKESNRLEGIAAGLRAFGADASAEGDALIIRGPRPLSGAAVDAAGDHRMAMAFAVAALAARGETELSGAESAAVSHPGFFEDLAALLGDGAAR